MDKMIKTANKEDPNDDQNQIELKSKNPNLIAVDDVDNADSKKNSKRTNSIN